MTTSYLGLVSAGAIGGSGVNAVLPQALLYGGLAQLVVGMWELENRNTFGAVAFSSHRAFWISFYAMIKYWIPGLSSGAAHRRSASTSAKQAQPSADSSQLTLKCA